MNDLDLCLGLFKVMSTTAASITPKLLELDFKFGSRFVWGMPSGRTNNFP